MKKVFFLISLFALFFSSCEGPMGPPGKDFVPYVKNMTIKSSDWKLVESTDYVSVYERIVDLEIGKNAYEKGIVNVYIYQVEGKNEVQAKLPQWVQHSDRGNTWIEGYDYNFDQETIAFFAECKKDTRPPTCEFRIVIAP